MLAAMFLWSCGGGASQQHIMEEQLIEAKGSVTSDLTDIKEDLEERIEYLDDQIEQAEDELKEKLKEARAQLKIQQAIIEQELEVVKEANLDTWDSVVERTTETVTNVRTNTNDASLEVRGLLEGN